MSEKHLTEAAWKVFAKGRGLKDAALLKTLVDVEKSRKAPAAEQLAALDAAQKQLDALLRLIKSDKEVAAYLNEIDKQIGVARSAAQAAAKAGADDEDTPALLTTKLLSALRQVLKGDPAHAMIALVGKACAVSVSAKPVGASGRKLLAEHLNNVSGIKYLEAQCILEQKVHTFVLPASVGGLAAKLQLAIAAQTGQKFRVRVRGADPKDVDEASDEGTSTQANDAKDDTAPLQATFTQLMPQIRQAIATDPGRKAEMLQLVERFQVLAKAGDAARAKAVLVEIVGALKRAGPADKRAAALSAWQAQRSGVIASLKQLETSIRAMRDPEGDAAIILVKAIQANLSEAPATLQAVDELDRYLRTDDIIAEAEEPNGFGIAIRIREPLLPALAALKTALAPA